jgi:DNA polymerase-4
MGPVILHLDMDAFFAAIEQREDPALRGKPVLVGRRGPRGVVSTCSYEARPSGVRSAMPSVTAERLCPDGIWVAPHFELYHAVSDRVFTLFRELVPVVEQTGVDEAYGDLTGAAADLEAGAALARRLKDAIRQSERLTASAGLSYCRFLAKIASDLEKPDGLVVIRREDIRGRLWPLPVRVIPGVGPKSAARLLRMGIKTVGELARCPEHRLKREFDSGMTLYLLERARGEDDTPIEEGGERKQISEERTYTTDLTAREEIEREILARCEGVAAELRRKDMLARTIVLKVRDGEYHTVTRTRTVPEPIDLAADLHRVAARLLRERVELRGPGVRLLGVAAKDLLPSGELPPSLFPAARRLRARAGARAADRLRERFGDEAVIPARLLDGKKPKGRGKA